MLQFTLSSPAQPINLSFTADHGAMAAYTLSDRQGGRGASPNNNGAWAVAVTPPFDPLGEGFSLSVLTAVLNGQTTNIRMTASQSGAPLPELSGAQQTPQGYLLAVVPPNGAAMVGFWVG